MDHWEQVCGGEAARACSRTRSQGDWGLKVPGGEMGVGGETLHPIKGAEVKAW